MTLKLPDILYIQIEDPDGNIAESIDDIETYCWERVNDSDAVYYRAGKRIPRRAELENLRQDLDRAIWIIRGLEKGNKDVSVIWHGGKPFGIWQRDSRTRNRSNRE